MFFLFISSLLALAAGLECVIDQSLIFPVPTTYDQARRLHIYIHGLAIITVTRGPLYRVIDKTDKRTKKTKAG